MNKKKELGQFNTTNVDYILQGLENLIAGKAVVDPYAGNGDLLKWAKKNGAKPVIGYDIDPNCIKNNIFNNDSLITIPPSGNFILTNPPYLYKGKMNEYMKKKYMLDDCVEDLYHLSLLRIINSDYDEGIIIIPVNFFSAENSDKIRKKFLDVYDIENVNYFTEQVFDDTTYNVVAFHFFKSTRANRILEINIFPERKECSLVVEKEFDYRIGGRELYNIINCKKILNIKRLTEDMMNENVGSYKVDGYYNDYKTIVSYNLNKAFKQKIDNNIIVLNCIDSKLENKICAEDIKSYNKHFLVGKNTSRNIAYILIDDITIETQKKLVFEFNKKLNELREKYSSLFLTNFRDNNRKRISFDFCYKLLNYCYINCY
jgi:hypothetical protein